jgi:hypothetical protein
MKYSKRLQKIEQTLSTHPLGKITVASLKKLHLQAPLINQRNPTFPIRANLEASFYYKFRV